MNDIPLKVRLLNKNSSLSMETSLDNAGKLIFKQTDFGLTAVMHDKTGKPLQVIDTDRAIVFKVGEEGLVSYVTDTQSLNNQTIGDAKRGKLVVVDENGNAGHFGGAITPVIDLIFLNSGIIKNKYINHSLTHYTSDALKAMLPDYGGVLVGATHVERLPEFTNAFVKNRFGVQKDMKRSVKGTKSNRIVDFIAGQSKSYGTDSNPAYQLHVSITEDAVMTSYNGKNWKVIATDKLEHPMNFAMDRDGFDMTQRKLSFKHHEKQYGKLREPLEPTQAYATELSEETIGNKIFVWSKHISDKSKWGVHALIERQTVYNLASSVSNGHEDDLPGWHSGSDGLGGGSSYQPGPPQTLDDDHVLYEVTNHGSFIAVRELVRYMAEDVEALPQPEPVFGPVPVLPGTSEPVVAEEYPERPPRPEVEPEMSFESQEKSWSLRKEGNKAVLDNPTGAHLFVMQDNAPTPINEWREYAEFWPMYNIQVFDEQGHNENLTFE